MSHYYNFNEKIPSDRKVIDVYFNEIKLSFLTDNGVFSKKEVDYGSYILIKELLKNNKVDKVLDVGCGYGIIGITLSYFDKCNQLTMIDINPRAVELSKLNSQRFKCSNCQVYLSDCLDAVTDSYDLIAINPPIRAGKVVIYKMFTQAYERLLTNGRLYIVIKKDLGAPSALKKLKEIFNNVNLVDKNKGYWIITAQK